jgi:hypothetical protein
MRRSNFTRKLFYMGLALALFVVILQVRKPIDAIRTDRGLSETTLGDVDPTSATMVLVLGGMRGIAVNFLWAQALELQKNEDWYAYEPVVESIIKLQPHFVRVWTFQGWNLAYNISVEWDQIDDKYYWIKHGIKFLQRGTRMNADSPELLWDVGWTYFHKIGKSDEAMLMRKKFQQDVEPEIDAQGRVQPAFNPEGLDNFMASLKWFQSAVTKLDEPPIKKPKRMGEVPFRSYPAHARTNSVQAEEEEGQFGERIAAGWLYALQLWNEFADFEYAYTEGKKVKLDYTRDIYDDLYRSVTLMTRAESLRRGLPMDWVQADPRELVAHTYLVWSELTAADIEKLSSEERTKRKSEWATEVWAMIVRDMPQLLTEFGQSTIDILPVGAADHLKEMRTTFEKAKGLDPNLLVRDDAEGERVRKLFAEFGAPAEKLGALAHEELYWCDRYATMANFRYWKERAVAESESDTISVRQLFYTGLESFRDGDPETAHTKLKQGLEIWKTVLDKFPRMKADDLTVEETVRIVTAYKAVRDQLDMPPLSPDETPFQDYMNRLAPPSPEEYEKMMRQYQEMQKQGGRPGMEMIKPVESEKAPPPEGASPPAKSTPKKTATPPESPEKD